MTFHTNLKKTGKICNAEFNILCTISTNWSESQKVIKCPVIKGPVFKGPCDKVTM